MNTTSHPLPKFTLSSLLVWITLSCVLLGFVTCLLFITNRKEDTNEPNYYVPAGYRSQVIDMTKSHSIRHESEPATNTRTSLPQWGKLLFDESRASQKQVRFYKESNRLRRDLNQFNETGSGFFEVRLDGNIYIAKQFHNFSLPYPERPGWKGSLSLDGEKLPALVSPNLYLGFSATEGDGTPNASQFATLSRQAWTKPSRNQTHYRSRVYELLGNDTIVATFIMTGDQVLMTFVDMQQTLIYLNGTIINSGATSSLEAVRQRRAESRVGDKLPPKTLPLRDGDRLRLVHKPTGAETPLRFGRYAGNMVSRRWLEDGREINVVDPELAAELPYVEQLHQALNNYVRSHPDPSKIGQPNIRLTLDHNLHQNLNKEFLQDVRNFDSNRSNIPDIQLQPACLTVMNAYTGEVLAMPSYPAPQDIENLRKKTINKTIRGVTDARLRRLSTNQNLVLTPIGSTTKPLFAAAIWETNPELSKLVIQEPKGQRQTIAGYQLAEPFSTNGPRQVDSKGFLRMSSNDYTMHLAILMLHKNVRIDRNGQPVFGDGSAANLGSYFKDDRIPGGFNRPDDIPAFPKFSECFDIGLVYDPDNGPAEKWDATLLSTLFRQIGVTEEIYSRNAKLDLQQIDQRTRLFTSFSNVLPESANLNLDNVHSVRGSYTSMFLGSGNNYWSNLQLAQAYSRVGTGRLIEAHIVSDAKKTANADHYKPLPLSRNTLAKVHAGMQECAEDFPDSTARQIAPAIRAARANYAAQGIQLFTLAKTGTARRRLATKDAQGRLINPNTECAAFCLFLELRDNNGKPLAALTSSLYLQDRASVRDGTAPRNSGVAVEMTKNLLPQMLAWLNQQPAVKRVRGSSQTKSN
jgi:cell division protein FtsI/penicillin-binding protein 2